MPEAIYTARPLTDEEKIFAEKNHNLMYRYIRIHELESSCGIVDRHTKRNTFITGER